jgi:anti-repressor protein
MDALIVIERREISPSRFVETVDARELWRFLGVGDRFTDWLFARLDKYQLKADEDYIVRKVTKQVPHEGGLRNQVTAEYFLTIDSAKELAMVQNNDKGREVRRYFIECERLAIEARLAAANATPPQPVIDPMLALSDPVTLRGLLLDFTNQVLTLKATVEEQLPKVQALKLISTCTFGSLCITDAAKNLQIAPTVLFRWMQTNNWIYRRSGTDWIAYQERIKQGLLEHKVTKLARENAEDKIVQQVRVLPSGLTALAEIFSKSSQNIPVNQVQQQVASTCTA